MFVLFRDTDLIFFFFNDTATTEIYTLSLHDALPISGRLRFAAAEAMIGRPAMAAGRTCKEVRDGRRSEEHTSELQSQSNLVCRLLLEKKKPTRVPRRSAHLIMKPRSTARRAPALTAC